MPYILSLAVGDTVDEGETVCEIETDKVLHFTICRLITEKY